MAIKRVKIKGYITEGEIEVGIPARPSTHEKDGLSPMSRQINDELKRLGPPEAPVNRNHFIPSEAPIDRERHRKQEERAKRYGPLGDGGI